MVRLSLFRAASFINNDIFENFLFILATSFIIKYLVRQPYLVGQSYFTEVAKFSENTFLYEVASSRKPASFISESILSSNVTSLNEAVPFNENTLFSQAV